MFKNFRIRFDGQDVGGFPDRAALEAGGRFALPDASELHVQFVRGFAVAELRVQRNGATLPGSDADPDQHVKTAAAVVYLVGGLTLAIGLLAELADVTMLRNLGAGWASAAEGVVFLVLAWFVGRRSRVALGIAIALYGLESVATLYVSLSASGSPSVGGIVMKVFFLVAMVRGFKAMSAPAITAPVAQVYR
jgi:hypothetical protein